MRWTAWRSLPEASILLRLAAVRRLGNTLAFISTKKIAKLVRAGEGYGFRLHLPPGSHGWRRLMLRTTLWPWRTICRLMQHIGDGQGSPAEETASFQLECRDRSSYRARRLLLLTEEMISFEQRYRHADMSYGWAKLTCEYLAQLALREAWLKSICYRPFSGYGEDQDDAYPFPSICKRVLAERGAKVRMCGEPGHRCGTHHIEDCVDAS